MKILDITDMLEAAVDTEMPNFEQYKKAIEAAATLLAVALARHLKVSVGPATFENDTTGVCADFRPKRKGQKCPEAIDIRDEGGEFEFSDHAYVAEYASIV